MTMNRISLIVTGVLATVIASLLGLVLIPDWQMQSMGSKQLTLPDGSVVQYPAPLDDFREAPGRKVYRSLGCVYCHSQQVRPDGFGADLERGWGTRRSVPRDYLLQNPPYLGTMRTGPDLANIGVRQPSDEWHYLHLYNPQLTSPGSVMPPFRFLFETYRGTRPNPAAGYEAYQLPSEAGEPPTWIVPQERAMQLVAYLKALQQAHALEEVR